MTESEPIVVGVDGSETAASALRWAADEAARRGCPLEVISVSSEHAAGQIEAVAARCPTVHMRVTETPGTPARALVTASRGAAMLVVGSRNGHLGGGALLGSVSAYCTAHALCPVVVVPDPGRATDFVGRADRDVVSALGPLL